MQGQSCLNPRKNRDRRGKIGTNEIQVRTLEMCAVTNMVGRPNKNEVGGRVGGRCTRMDDATNIGFESRVLKRRDHVGDIGLRQCLLLSR